MITRQSVFLICSEDTVPCKGLRALESKLASDFDLIKTGSSEEFFDAMLREIAVFERTPSLFICDLAVKGARERELASEIYRAYPHIRLVSVQNDARGGCIAEEWRDARRRKPLTLLPCDCARVLREEVARALPMW